MSRYTPKPSTATSASPSTAVQFTRLRTGT
jgi:hypothetical protein